MASKPEFDSLPDPIKNLPEIYSNDKNSIVNKMPAKYIKFFMPDEFRKLCDKPEDVLEKTMFISDTLERLRKYFWYEYKHATENNKMMDMDKVRLGVCSESTMEKYFEDPYALAWILKKPRTSKELLSEAFNLGIERIKDVLGISAVKLVGGKPEVDLKLARAQTEILRFFSNYLHPKTGVNININKNMSDDKPGVKTIEIDELDRRIEELKDEI
jgi:hypothetical protein